MSSAAVRPGRRRASSLAVKADGPCGRWPRLSPRAQWVEAGASAEVLYNVGFLAPAEADQAFRAMGSLPFAQQRVRVFGREHATPRLTAWFAPPGVSYAYSGIAMTPHPFPPFLEILRQAVEAATALPFNSALANCYRNGQDKIGWHSDDEPELGDEIHVASLSLGAVRTFRFRAKKDHRRAFSQELGHGSLLLMRHPAQRHWEHCLPARANVSGARMNLTFRNVARSG